MIPKLKSCTKHSNTWQHIFTNANCSTAFYVTLPENGPSKMSVFILPFHFNKNNLCSSSSTTNVEQMHQKFHITLRIPCQVVSHRTEEKLPCFKPLTPQLLQFKKNKELIFTSTAKYKGICIYFFLQKITIQPITYKFRTRRQIVESSFNNFFSCFIKNCMHHRVLCEPDLDLSHTQMYLQITVNQAYIYNNIRNGTIDATKVVKHT